MILVDLGLVSGVNGVGFFRGESQVAEALVAFRERVSLSFFINNERYSSQKPSIRQEFVLESKRKYCRQYLNDL